MKKSCLGLGCGGLIIVLLIVGVVGFFTSEVDANSEAQAPASHFTAVTPTPEATEPTPEAPEPTPEPSEPAPAPGEAATFIATVDGDTINTSQGTVRLIGIDTPERNECGAGPASALIDRELETGDRVWLDLPTGQNDTDAYARLLRYVTLESGDDLGMLQMQEGNAAARYDSRDGYPAHPQESAYHNAQTARLVGGAVVTPECAEAAAQAAEHAQREESSSDYWWIEFRSCSHLQKSDSHYPKGPFNRDNPAEAKIYDYFANQTGYRGDGDGDGLACE